MILKTLSLVLALSTQPAEPQSAEINLHDLSWMQGCWEGTGFGQRVSECWMPSDAGSLTGMFQLFKEDGTQNMSEIFVLRHFQEGPAMRLKHFNPDMTSWEAQDEYVTFRLIESGPDLARFEGLVYRYVAPDRMIAELDVRTPQGVQVFTLTYSRVDFAPDE